MQPATRKSKPETRKPPARPKPLRRDEAPKPETRSRKLPRLVPALLDWYAAHARNLPWRRTRRPYAIWVSEIMLQQTQVKTVLPYWKRWMRELPTLNSLAKAPSQKLHKLWEGLGYYTRVRNLQKAAQQILDLHGGRFPETFEHVLALPGIGRYTAGAICSFAFDLPTPVLDGNVIRVLTRSFGIDGNPRERKTNAALWRLAQDLVLHAAASGAGYQVPGLRSQVSGVRKPETRNPGPSRLNQSLMELGALICTPRIPRCDVCPLAKECSALRENRVGDLPRLARPTPPTARRFAAFVLQSQSRVLVRQRPPGAVNAHLWEFPNVELNETGSNLQSAARRLLGFTPRSLKKLCAIRHSITRYRILLEAFSVHDPRNGHPNQFAGRWLPAVQLARLPFPSAHHKILRLLSKSKAGSAKRGD